MLKRFAASDRIAKNGEGIVAFITNNSFVDNIAFDGMRKHLARDFNKIYILDLGGNVRKNPKLSGTKHNVFGIQVGVSINILLKKKEASPTRIFYASTGELWQKEDKFQFLEKTQSILGIEWRLLTPDENYTWLTEELCVDFEDFFRLGNKTDKNRKTSECKTIFRLFSLGVATNRDSHVYSFNLTQLNRRVRTFVEIYNSTVDTWKRRRSRLSIEDVINITDIRIKWTRQLKRSLQNAHYADFVEKHFRTSIYRPFTKQNLYYDNFWNEEQYQISRIIPKPETENLVICLTAIGNKKPFHCLMTNVIPDLHLTGDSQCFPFYTYDEDGNNRQENITDWALEQFQVHYQSKKISKRDIFYYVYAILHHPQYRKKYAANLRRELPRIPFVDDFQAFVKAGAKLADLHVNYEEQREYPLKRMENKNVLLNWRVEKMKLSKDKLQLIYNDFLTFTGIPSEAFEYQLGNRSALEWIIDQYQIKTRSDIVNDPNRQDDPKYIVRLIGKVITVSLETLKIVKGLPKLE